jgi:hypothetical protein
MIGSVTPHEVNLYKSSIFFDRLLIVSAVAHQVYFCRIQFNFIVLYKILNRIRLAYFLC